MHVHKAYKVRLYPTEAQAEAFRQIAGCGRLVYNAGLEHRRVEWGRASRRNGLSFYAQAQELKAAKAAFPFLKDVPAHCLQESLKDLDDAYRRFFAGQSGFPKPRKKYEHDSFTFPDPQQIRVEPKQGRLILPKFGRTKSDNGAVHAIFHRRIKGKVKRVTISRAGDAWCASIQVRVKARNPVHPAQHSVTGVDRGVAEPFVTDRGETFGHAVMTMKEAERRKRLQQQLARQKKGSANRRETRLKLAKLDARIARRRSDMLHQTSAHLAKNHGVVVLERLDVQSMTASASGSIDQPGTNVRAKAGLNRSMLDKGWGEFRRQLAYKLDWRGGMFIEVAPHQSSQTCPACRHVDPASRVRRDTFSCTACGHTDHADRAAAIEIRHRGLAEIGWTNDPSAVEPAGSHVETSAQHVDEAGRRTLELAVPKRRTADKGSLFL